MDIRHIVTLTFTLLQGFQCRPDHHRNSNILSKLELIPAKDHVEIKVGRNYTFCCRGTAPLTWHWGQMHYSNHSRMGVEEKPCQGQKEAHLTCSHLRLTKAQVIDTGYITCLYKNQTKSSMRLQAKMYLYVKDNAQPFLEINTVEPGIAIMDSANELVIPCRVSSPEWKVTLHYFYNKSQVVQPGMQWDPKIGFTIPSPHSSLYEIVQCNTVVKGKHFHTLFWRQNVGYTHTMITDVTAESSTLLVGDRLSLLCVGEVPFNSRVILEWVHKKKVLHSKKGHYPTEWGNVGDRHLVIENVTMDHNGVYTCRDVNFPRIARNISITVHGK